MNLIAIGGDRATAAELRCPHLLFHDAFGMRTVVDLLDYANARQFDFSPGEASERYGTLEVDLSQADCRCLADIGRFEAPMRAAVSTIAPQALREFGLFETEIGPLEYEISAYGDGGHFAPHVDSFGSGDRARILTFVYYFSATPRPFSGGALRLHAFPTTTAKSWDELPVVDIDAETDSLVIFPSWLCHEVMPVKVPSAAWQDSRFTVTCWVHRPTPVPAGTRRSG